MAATNDELPGGAVLQRFEREVASTLRRRSPQEAKLGGALRCLAPHDPRIRDLLADAGAELARRGAFERDLFTAAIRDLVESSDPRALPLLEAALSQPQGGGPAVLSASAFVRDAELSERLFKLAMGSTTHLAFAAELSRVVRGDTQGERLAGLAPKLKESYRVAVCADAFLPLLRLPFELPATLTRALTVLRDAERHLGRWLILSQVAMRAGDEAPLAEAKQRVDEGPKSARAAWALSAWVLDPSAPAPEVRPTMGLVARLSDRPSTERDTSFLFRMAEARLPSAEPVLASLVRDEKLADETAIRAAMYLARDGGRGELREALIEAATSGEEALRGLAAAALWDIGETEVARQAAGSLAESRLLVSVAWSALISAADASQLGPGCPVLTESAFRRLHRGWVSS